MFSKIAFLARLWLALSLLSLAFLPAGITDQGGALPSNLHAVAPHPNLLERAEAKGLPLPDMQANLQHGIDRPRALTNPPSGNFKMLVVLVMFSDRPPAVAPSFFDQLVFTPPGPGVNSVADYYSEISYGTFTIVPLYLPSTLNWMQATNPHAYYVNADGTPGTFDDWGFGIYPQNLQGIVADMLPKLDPLVDFSQYDNDGDGFVEGITFVHAGRGAEWTGSPGDIWSSAWNMTDGNGPGPILVDGVRVDNFAFDPEYMSTPGDQTIGVYCHEIGHTLFGLPDLYDYDGSSYGVGNWSLMAYGSWNGPSGMGSSPAWPDAWSRTLMGFEKPITIAGNMAGYIFPPVEQQGGPTAVVRLQSPQMGPDEYFLLEHRGNYANTYDAYLPGAGLLIWHIDEEKWNNWELNTNECRTVPCCTGQCKTLHPLVALEQADGARQLELAINYGDSTDPFPTVSNTMFAFGTNPESGSYLASTCPSNSCINVNGITFIVGSLIQANLNVVCTQAGGCGRVLLSEPIGWGAAGSEVRHIVTLQNCANTMDPAMTLSTSGLWPVQLFNPIDGSLLPNPYQLGMAPGAGWNIGITVTVPATATWGMADLLTLNAQPSLPPYTPASASLETRVPRCVLLVDDDQNLPNTQPQYIAALSQNNLAFDLWDVSLWGRPDAGVLAEHSAVIWYTGYPRLGTLAPRDELALAGYLDSGGDLFFSSQDYLYDVGRNSFNRIYLPLMDFFDDIGTSTIIGLPGPVGSGLGPYTLTPPTLFSDVILPLPPALPAFSDGVGNPNALTYENGTWQALYLAWPFENLAPPDGAQVMAATANWFSIPPQPSVNFTSDASLACVGWPVTFTNQSQDATAYLWDFGDGQTSTLTDTVHTYSTAMTATVTLAGSNCCGVRTALQVLPVINAAAAGFSPSATVVEVGEPVTFTNTSQDAQSYLWDFGDGVTSTLSTPTYAYTQTGEMIVTLTASNGCSSDVVTQTIAVYAPASAGFTPSAVQAAVDEPITFTNTSQNADSYAWDFGDGIGTSTETHPTYAYASAGSHTVSLTAANAHSTDVYSQTIVVYEAAVAGFTPSATQVMRGEQIHFTNTSLNADTYAWDFGDGLGSSTETSPYYAYTISGTYTVTLTASNLVSSDTAQAVIVVSDEQVSYTTFLPLIKKSGQTRSVDAWQSGASSFPVGAGMLLAGNAWLAIGRARRKRC